MQRIIAVAVLAVAVAFATIAPAGAQEITGAGSTFVYPILSKWSADYSEMSSKRVNYQSIGSGGGIAQVKAGTVDFGASDMPLPPDDLAALGLAQFPLVIGGILPVVNLPGIEAGRLKLTGPVLAGIYLGQIKSWNDPAITALNPGLALPASRIIVVHRSDGSGTTFNWVDYLSKISPEWKAKVGANTSVAWPTGVGGKGNEGVAAYVERLKGAIGYVEYAYVLQNKMAYALVQNAAGAYVTPGAASFQAAAASADWRGAKDFSLVMTNAPGAGAYPVTATTFILLHKVPRDAARGHEAIGFFTWALEHGQAAATALDYVPMPAPVVAMIEQYWHATLHD